MKNKMIKKIISTLLAAVLISGMMPNVPLIASEGDSSEETTVSDNSETLETGTAADEKNDFLVKEDSLIAEEEESSESVTDVDFDDDSANEIEEENEEVCGKESVLGKPDLEVTALEEDFLVEYNTAFYMNLTDSCEYSPIKSIKDKDDNDIEYEFVYEMASSDNPENIVTSEKILITGNIPSVCAVRVFADKDKSELYKDLSFSLTKLTADFNCDNAEEDLIYTGEAIDLSFKFETDHEDDVEKVEYALLTYDEEDSTKLPVVGEYSESITLKDENVNAGIYHVTARVTMNNGQIFELAEKNVEISKAVINCEIVLPEKTTTINEKTSVLVVEKYAVITFSLSCEDIDGTVEYSVLKEDSDDKYVLIPSSVNGADVGETETTLYSQNGKFKVNKSGDVNISASVKNSRNHIYQISSKGINIHCVGDPLFKFVSSTSTDGFKYSKDSNNAKVNNNVVFPKSETNDIIKLYTAINSIGNGSGRKSDENNANGWFNNYDIQWLKAEKIYDSSLLGDINYSIEVYDENGKTPFRVSTNKNIVEFKPNLTSDEQDEIIADVDYDKDKDNPVLSFNKSTGQFSYAHKHNFHAFYLGRKIPYFPSFKITATLPNGDIFEKYSESYIVNIVNELPSNENEGPTVTERTEIEDGWVKVVTEGVLEETTGWFSKAEVSITEQGYSAGLNYISSNEMNAELSSKVLLKDSSGDDQTILGWKNSFNDFAFKKYNMKIDSVTPRIESLSYREDDSYDSKEYEPTGDTYYFGPNKPVTLAIAAQDERSGINELNIYFDPFLDVNGADDYEGYLENNSVVEDDEYFPATIEDKVIVKKIKLYDSFNAKNLLSTTVSWRLPYGDYACRIFVEVVDNAGNSYVVKGSVIENNSQKEGGAYTIIEDSTAPDCIITVAGKVPEGEEDPDELYKNGRLIDGTKYFRNDVTARIDLYENNFTDDIVEVNISNDGGETFKKYDSVVFHSDSNVHVSYEIDGEQKMACKATAELKFTEDGQYLIKVDATDNSGNVMTTVYSANIVIDTVAPVFTMDLSEASNKKSIYKKPADDGNAEAGETPTQKETNDDITYYYGASEPSNGGVVATMKIVEKNFFPEDVKVVLENEKGEYTVLNLYNTEEEPAVNYWKTSTKKSDPDSGSDSNTDTDPDSNTDTDPDSNTDTDPDSNPNPDPNSNPNPDPNPDPDSNLNPDPDANSGTNSLMGNIINGISNFVIGKTNGYGHGGNSGNSGNGGSGTGNGGGNNDTPDEIVNTCKIALFVPNSFEHDADTFAMNIEEGKYRIKVVYSDRSGNAMCGKEDDPGMLTWQTTVTNPETQEKESVEESGYATPHLVFDVTAPKVKITYSGASSKRSLKGFADSQNTYTYYAGTLNGTVTVQEKNFDTEDSSLYKFKFAANSVSGGDARVSLNECISKWSPSVDMYTMACTFKNDANYTFGFEKLADLAGNVAVLPKPDYFTVDKTNPKITEIKYSTPVLDTVLNAVTFGFYNAKVTVSVTAEDATAGVHEFNYSYTNAAGVSGVNASLSNQIVSEGNIKYSNDHSKATLTFTIPKDALDSNHQFNGTVKVSVKDRSDNSAAREDNKRIVVDTIAPTATVSYNAPVNERGDKFYYASDITGTVTINEANFYATDVAVTVSKNGSEGSVLTTSWTDQSTDVHVGHFTLSEEGEYIVRINYKDKSTNTMTEYVSGLMVIDKTIDEPVFKINGVEKSGDMGGAYKDELNVSYSFNDTNYNASEVKLTKISFAQKDDVTATYIKTTETSNGGNGTFDIAKAVDTDGIYLLEISMSDLAGHSIEQYVKFTANRYGSVFEYSDYLVWLISDGGQYVKLNGDEAITENLVITEYNPDRVENGSLSITATRDGEAVPVDYTTVESEINRSAEQTPNGWFTYIYTIDKANFIEDGHYKISISSSDATGNTTTSVPDNSFDAKGNKILDIMSFTVDTTNPEIRNIINLDSSVINAQTLEVKYSLLDLGGLKSVEAYVDGKPVETALDLEQGSNNYNGSFILEDSPVAQEVRLVIEDLAGNVTDTDDSTWKDEQVRAGSYVFKNPVTVSTNLMVLWLANKFAFFGSIGLVTVLVIGGVVFVVARKKRY